MQSYKLRGYDKGILNIHKSPKCQLCIFFVKGFLNLQKLVIQHFFCSLKMQRKLFLEMYYKVIQNIQK